MFSDDDNSFELEEETLEVINISSDHSKCNEESDEHSTEDESNLPLVDIKNKKTNAIRNLFGSSKRTVTAKLDKFKFQERNKNVALPIPSTSTAETSKLTPVTVCERPIGGVKVQLPVTPYGSQMALMFKVITAIKNRENCLLESPTGSGKTLALLCSALAWQQQEKNRIAEMETHQYFSCYPEINEVKNAAEFIRSSPNNSFSPEKIFTKPIFGERSIYNQTDPVSTRPQSYVDLTEGSPEKGLVNIHKRRRLASDGYYDPKTASPNKQSTPEKNNPNAQQETPPKISLPTIYYGARTHKQLQQVIKEFKRTSYCLTTKMTILSSREYSCIKELDKQLWNNRNDMCRACIKTFSSEKSGARKQESNCKFYDNRTSLNHWSLPPAFDLEELVNIGTKTNSCPYFAARLMAQSSNIVFCPYNYLIEPSIRSSMQIDLKDNIVIIDEGHNIEDICRDSATLSFAREHVQGALAELKNVAEYRFTNEDTTGYLEYLIKALKNFDDWFGNQLPLLNNVPEQNNEAVYTWEVEHFVQTLNNHNIGQNHYEDFSRHASEFCQRVRDDPRTLFGITQPTCNLIEDFNTALGYLFRSSGQFLDDFKPVLVKTIKGKNESLSEAKGWKASQFNKWVSKESLSLRLLCLNPGVVFAAMGVARCVVLASGTLAPLLSLHSELATGFPLCVSPAHVIPPERVWVGTLATGPQGEPLECSRRGLAAPHSLPSLGRAVLAVARVTPHGVLCFLPSYHLLNSLVNNWQQTDIWHELNETKHVFMESRNTKDHNDIMDDYYKYVSSSKGALLFAVFRGKVSEGMDFKDHQARAVITIGIPYPNLMDMAVKEKMKYNDKYSSKRNLLPSREWLRVQAYRALNQAVGRCVRHRGDWGAVLLIDARFNQPYYLEHLSGWVKNFLGTNHHTFDSLMKGENSLETFMKNMTLIEKEDI